MILYMPRARQQSFYSSTGFSCLRFQFNGLRSIFAISEETRFSQDTLQASILTESTSDQSTVVVKRSSSHKRHYPPQFKHPPRVASARVLKNNRI